MKNTDKITVPTFQYFYRVDVLLLRLMGFSSFDTVFSSDEFNSNWRDGCHFVIRISMILLVVLSQLHAMFYIGIGLNYSMEVFLAMCTTLLCAIKGIRWWTHRHQLHNIIHQLSLQWQSIRAQNILTIENVKVATNTKSVQTTFITSVLARSLENIVAGNDYSQHDDYIHSQLRNIAIQHNQLFS
ncbi:hypothetical protein PV327_006255 [Microctonus hyperodae]|uniref:Uncharacterized protein n=1 Tax=Microctonus hyperodae TaxID=165561 RepID=A0AA39F409_MICHY|nr:hypothetical protein PV327_006255 [Microctonus hyperodae]